MGTADLRYQWALRRLRRPGPQDRAALQSRAKLSFRLVPNQDPRSVDQQFRDHVAKVCPPGVTCKVITHHGVPAVLVNVDTPGVHAAARAIEAGFGTKPVFMREGGSIPVVGLIKEQLGVDTLLLGWGQTDDNLHGPNEKFCLADFHRGIKASASAPRAGRDVEIGIYHARLEIRGRQRRSREAELPEPQRPRRRTRGPRPRGWA